MSNILPSERDSSDLVCRLMEGRSSVRVRRIVARCLPARVALLTFVWHMQQAFDDILAYQGPDPGYISHEISANIAGFEEWYDRALSIALNIAGVDLGLVSKPETRGRRFVQAAIPAVCKALREAAENAAAVTGPIPGNRTADDAPDAGEPEPDPRRKEVLDRLHECGLEWIPRASVRALLSFSPNTLDRALTDADRRGGQLEGGRVEFRKKAIEKYVRLRWSPRS